MTYQQAQAILYSQESTELERWYAKCWMKQQDLFPGDVALNWMGYDPLTVPVVELMGR